jgi:F-type H+-transporting ATPase subunit b
VEGLGINLGYLLIQIIAFIVIYTLLTRFIYDPLSNVLKARRVRIAKGLEDAAAAANARRNAEAEAERIVAAARADAARVIEEARARGEEVARQVEADARQEADNIRAEGRARANEERDRQLADLRGQVAAIAIAVSQRLIGESLDEKRQQALINDFFSKVPADARSLQGPVEVVSAMPLSPEEQARVKSEIGVQDATFSVDPSILGGLVIRTEQRVVDGSVRSGLTELAGRLR